jgi:hypothetical protein
MAQIDGVLAELRHRIMGPFESGPLKSATQEMDCAAEHSAVVAPRRLAHPRRDGGVVAEDASVSEPVNPERIGGVVVGDDPLSPLIRWLSIDKPELMEEVVAFIERRTAVLNDDGGAPRPPENVAPGRSAVLSTAEDLDWPTDWQASPSLSVTIPLVLKVVAQGRRWQTHHWTLSCSQRRRKLEISRLFLSSIIM